MCCDHAFYAATSVQDNTCASLESTPLDGLAWNCSGCVCPSPALVACDGVVLSPSSPSALASVGDGVCDNGQWGLHDFNCAAYNFDGGDCVGATAACRRDGQTFAEWLEGSGAAEDGGAALCACRDGV